MSNQIFGIITVIICSIGYFFSWKYNIKGNYKVALILLIICGLLLRIYTSTDMFLHAWDERYHALVAKNLMGHMLTPTLYENPVLPYSIESWTTNHIWLHKQPLPLWTMAASMSVFGINEIALRIPSILLSTIGIGLTFSIAFYFFNKKVAYLASFLFSINGLILEITGGRVATDHIDLFFLFFIELAIFFSIQFVKKQNTIFNFLVGISIGLAILSKWLPALIVLPIWLLIIIDSKKFSKKEITLQFLFLITICSATFLPWQLYIHTYFPAEAQWESSFNMKHITHVLDQQGGPFYYFIEKVRINYGELIYIPLLWFIWRIYIEPKDLKRLAIGLWFLIPLIFFSAIKTKMQAYILFISPALFMVTSEFWLYLFEYRRNIKYGWFFTLILILIVALPVRYSFERMKPFQKMDRNPEWAQQLRDLNHENFKNGMLFNCSRPIEAMFYTDLIAYDIIPDKKLTLELIQKGFTIVINDDGKLPLEIKEINDIHLIRLSENEKLGK